MEKPGCKGMNLKLLGPSFLPALNTGVTYANVMLSGNTSVSNEYWKYTVMEHKFRRNNSSLHQLISFTVLFLLRVLADFGLLHDIVRTKYQSFPSAKLDLREKSKSNPIKN